MARRRRLTPAQGALYGRVLRAVREFGPLTAAEASRLLGKGRWFYTGQYGRPLEGQRATSDVVGALRFLRGEGLVASRRARLADVRSIGLPEEAALNGALLWDQPAPQELRGMHPRPLPFGVLDA